MSKTTPYFLILPVVSILAFVGVSPQPLFAQGYEGLIAPETDIEESADTGSDTSDQDFSGYDGVLAPEDEGVVKKTPAVKKPNQPAVTAPSVPRPAPAVTADKKRPGGKVYESQFTMKERKPRINYKRGFNPDVRVRGMQDLKLMASIYGADKNSDGIPDKMAAEMKLPEDMTQHLNVPRPREKDGLLPMESNIKRSIDGTFQQIKAQKGTMRSESVKAALADLKRMHIGISNSSRIPDGIYKTMGLPDLYIKEEREGYNNSLKRIESAIRELEKLR